MHKLQKLEESILKGLNEETARDRAMKEMDFVLIKVNPYTIRWKNGKIEIVSKSKLEQLQKTHTWIADF